MLLFLGQRNRTHIQNNYFISIFDILVYNAVNDMSTINARNTERP